MPAWGELTLATVEREPTAWGEVLLDDLEEALGVWD